MPSIEEAAAGLNAALNSGNLQDAESAQAQYQEALDGADEPEFTLGPITGVKGIDLTPEEVDATDAAEALAEAEGVDLASVEGSGVDGRVLVADVQDAADAADGQA